MIDPIKRLKYAIRDERHQQHELRCDGEDPDPPGQPPKLPAELAADEGKRKLQDDYGEHRRCGLSTGIKLLLEQCSCVVADASILTPRPVVPIACRLLRARRCF